MLNLLTVLIAGSKIITIWAKRRVVKKSAMTATSILLMLIILKINNKAGNSNIKDYKYFDR